MTTYKIDGGEKENNVNQRLCVCMMIRFPDVLYETERVKKGVFISSLFRYNEHQMQYKQSESKTKKKKNKRLNKH